MESPVTPAYEPERLHAIRHLNILDTPPEERFDAITKAAAEELQVPISTISIVDANREWFKSCVGTAATEGPRDVSFCGHTIVSGKIFVINDTLKDARFADNPQVTQPPHIRFYAGVTLHDHATHLPVGAFCVKDTKPRELTLQEFNALLQYADKAEYELNKGFAPPVDGSGVIGQTPQPDSVHHMWKNMYGQQFGFCS
jgi:GAF domain-containing protein